MSEHWYSRTGEPAYETNGRGTTLRDARKLGLVPSVTTVLSVIDKPALGNWKCEQAILAALTMPRNDGESEAVYIKRILADSKASSIAAAAKGSEIHDACERMSNGLSVSEEYLPHATAAHAELKRLFPDVNDWVAEKAFAHPLGFGGKCDLHSPSTGIIVDYKTRDGDFTDGKRIAWDQFWQLAAYQKGLGLVKHSYDNPWDQNDIDAFQQGAIIFVSRTHSGAVASHVWSADEMEQGWGVFQSALQLWKAIKGFDPGWAS